MRLTGFFVLFALAACGTVSPGALARLSQMSPLETDPAVLRAAVDLPPGVDIVPGGVTIRLDATRSDTNERADQTFALSRTNTDTLAVYQLAEADIAAFRALQARINGWEAEAPEATSGSFQVNVTACSVGDGPAPDARYSVLIGTQANAPLVTLIDQGPVDEIWSDLDAEAQCPDLP